MADQERIVLVDEFNVEDEVFSSGVPVIVEFWAAWCSPCKELDPIFERLADEYLERAEDGYILRRRVKFCKVDADQSAQVVDLFKKRGIVVEPLPHIVVVSKGGVVGEISGFQGEESMKAKVQGLLSKVAL